MNAKKFYNILAILLGYGLIISGFIIFGKNLESRIRILDIIVSCLIYTQFVQFTLFPLINRDDPSHKEVGMIGIHLVSLYIFCTLSLGLIICGIIYDIPFKFQILGQLAILFILLIGRVLTLHAGEKVQQIYDREQKIMEGRSSLRSAMNDFSDFVSTVHQLDPAIIAKLNSMNEALRFLSPSASKEARSFDDQFIQSLEDLKVLMRNTSLNKEKIVEEVEHLERLLARRKKY